MCFAINSLILDRYIYIQFFIKKQYINNSMHLEMEVEPAHKKIKRIKDCIDEISKLEPIVEAEEQRFKIFMESGQIHYLDEKKSIALVTSEYLNVIDKKFSEVRSELTDLLKKLNGFENQEKMQNRQIEVLRQKLKSVQENLKTEKEKCSRLNGQLEDYKQKAQLNKGLQRQLIEKVNIIKVQHLPTVIPDKETYDKEIQTQFWIPVIELTKNVIVDEIQVKDFKSELTQKLEDILGVFQGNLEEVLTALSEKLKLLNQENLNNKYWIEKYNIVADENRRLQERMNEINLAEERLKHWKTAVVMQMKDIQVLAQATITVPTISNLVLESKQNTDPISQGIEIEYLRKEVAKLRNSLFQQRLKNQSQNSQQQQKLIQQNKSEAMVIVNTQNEENRMIAEENQPHNQQGQIKHAQNEDGGSNRNLEQQYQKFKQQLAALQTIGEQEHEDQGIVKKISLLSQRIKLIVEFIMIDI